MSTLGTTLHFHCVMQLNGELRHFVSDDPLVLLRRIAETKPESGYVLVRGYQYTAFDLVHWPHISQDDLLMLADVMKWEKEQSHDRPSSEDAEGEDEDRDEDSKSDAAPTQGCHGASEEVAYGK